LDGVSLSMGAAMIGTLTRLQSTLCGLAMIFGLASLYEFAAPLPAYSLTAAAPAHTLPEALPPASIVAPPAEAFAAIEDRPLFDAHRKKFEPPPAEAQVKAAPPPPNVFLLGVIIDPTTRLAILKAPDSALSTTLAIGGTIGGWQVAAIE